MATSKRGAGVEVEERELGSWRNLITNFRWLWIKPWLQQATLAEVVEVWQIAQRLKGEEEERRQERLNDPDSLYGKSSAYANTVFRQESEW